VNSNPATNLEDKTLIDRALSGDKQAFGLIIRNTEKLVTQIVFKMINDPQERKDIAQDIYLKAYKKLAGFKFQSKLSTWIAQISYNTCFDYLRKKRLILPHTIHEEPEAGNNGWKRAENLNGIAFDAFIVQKNLTTILQAEIEKLSPVYKTLITLYHNEELSYEEIEQITGLPAGTIKNYLFRARKALQKNLLINYKKEDL